MVRNVKLVFIFLGRTVPNYVLSNINRTSSLFGLETYFVVREADISLFSDKLNKNIKVRRLQHTNVLLNSKLEHDWNFRNGFWFYTLERLIALKQIHDWFDKDTAILHIEADMLLFQSFPFELVLGEKLKWFKHDNQNDVASLVFSPSKVETYWLHDEILKLAKSDPKLTDMSALFKIRRLNPERIKTFPDMFEVSKDNNAIGIFDGLAIGQWLTGMDPRNTYGFTVLHENSDFKSYSGQRITELLEGATFKVSPEGSLRIATGEVLTDLHCIHAHVKNHELFELDNQECIQRYLNVAADHKVKIFEFDFKVFSTLILQNFRDGKLKNYLLNLAKYLAKRDKVGGRRFAAILRFVFKQYLFRRK